MGRRLLIIVAAAAAIFYALGFALFAASVPAAVAADAEMTKADGIVALTGDNSRLGPAVVLLERGLGERLLITGVFPRTTKQELRQLLQGGARFDCCADLGFEAVDTRGNAREAAAWLRANHYKSLIVVTADYHMPRSLLEFSAAMPKIVLQPYPVAEDSAMGWWRKMRRLHGEYTKYLAAYLRIRLGHAARTI